MMGQKARDNHHGWSLLQMFALCAQCIKQTGCPTPQRWKRLPAMRLPCNDSPVVLQSASRSKFNRIVHIIVDADLRLFRLQCR